MFEHRFNAGTTRAFSDDMEVVEENDRILAEVSCAKNWIEVETILHNHKDHYFGLSPRVREYLNERIKDIMSER
jgi:hypothetical protein